MVGASAAMAGVFRWLSGAAQLQSPVVIEGEPGVGKVLAAQTLHRLSQTNAPLMVIDAESATGDAVVKAMSSHTVVLRRVENLDSKTQLLLVRAMKAQDVTQGRGRILATAFRPLAQSVREGAFREDLYFRLNVLPITLPPLRERREDIPALVRFGLSRTTQGKGQAFSSAALERMLGYPWPGNVRELFEFVAAAKMRSDGAEIGVESLPGMLVLGAATGSAILGLHPPNPLTSIPTFPEALTRGLTVSSQIEPEVHETPPPSGAMLPVSEHLSFKEAKAQVLVAFEREYLARVLKRSGGNITRSAEVSGLHRKSIERLVKKYGLKPRRKRTGVD